MSLQMKRATDSVIFCAQGEEFSLKMLSRLTAVCLVVGLAHLGDFLFNGYVGLLSYRCISHQHCKYYILLCFYLQCQCQAYGIKSGSTRQLSCVKVKVWCLH